MPDHKIHRTLTKALVGRAYPKVDQWMDDPYKKLGRGHRVLRHSVLEVAAKYNPITQPQEFQAGLAHLIADTVFKTQEQQVYMHLLMDMRVKPPNGKRRNIPKI